jgi:mono/diheme cytochrome c family protein
MQECAMKSLFHAVIGVAALAGLAGTAAAQPVRDRGKHEFETHCAVCHGADASGDGPLRPFLIKPPADLTTLARRNGGMFPTTAVMEMIDGRSTAGIGAHGPRQMPVWGEVYLEQAQQDPALAKLHPEWSVRARITALVDYLVRLQIK